MLTNNGSSPMVVSVGPIKVCELAPGQTIDAKKFENLKLRAVAKLRQKLAKLERTID